MSSNIKPMPQLEPLSLTSLIYHAAIDRNRKEVLPFRSVYESNAKARREHNEILQFHAECRAQIASLLVDYQGHFRSRAEAVGMYDEYSAIRSRLSALNDLFSSRFTKDSDIFRARLELADSIKRQNADIESLRGQVDDLQQSKKILQDQVLGLNIAIKDEQDRSKSLNSELNSVRSILEKCEERNQRLEVENAQLVSRFISEKEKMASEMNEMNNIVGGFRGFMGGGVSFVQGLKNTVIGAVNNPSSSSSSISASGEGGGGINDASGSGSSSTSYSKEKDRIGERGEAGHTRSFSMDAPARMSHSSSDDGDDGFEIIDGKPDASYDEIVPSSSHVAVGGENKRSHSVYSALPSAGRRSSRGGAEEAEGEGGRGSLVTDFAPPRCPASIEKIHATDINDVRTESNIVVTGGADATVKVTYLGSRDPVFSFLGTAPVLSVDIVDDTWVLGASSGAMSEVRVWNAINGRQRLSFGGHNNKILCARFIGANRAVTASADRTIKLWDIASASMARPLQTIPTNSSAESVALSSDLNYLASGHQDGGVRFWDVATAAKISLVPKAHTQHVHSLQWHPRSDRTLLVSSKEQPLKLIDTRTYEEVQVLKMKDFRVFSTKCCFSPDGSMAAAGGGDGTIVVWNTYTASVQCVLTTSTGLSSSSAGWHVSPLARGHFAGVTALDWGPSGLVSVDRTGVVIHWTS